MGVGTSPFYNKAITLGKKIIKPTIPAIKADIRTAPAETSFISLAKG